MIENYFQEIIQDLSVCHAVASFHVLKIELGEVDGYIRIKCQLSNGDTLEFAEYVKIQKNRIKRETYSYHWQSHNGNLRKRWDNVPHHKDIGTFPHHLHLPDKIVRSRPQSIKKILSDIENSLN